MEGFQSATQVSPSSLSTVVGIFVNLNQIEFLLSQKTSLKLAAIREAARLVQIVYYFFSLSDVDLKEKKINGTYYDEKSGLWKKKVFPYPDVLYARGGSMKQSEKFTLFYKQLQEMGVQRINSGPVFNKWDVLKNLKKNAKIAPHLPDTMIFTAANDLKLMFNKYDVLYLKACRGRKGHQVIRIKKLLANYFEYRYYRGSKLNKGFVNFVNLMQLVNNFFGTKSFLIQQAIDLPVIKNSIYDLRAEAQRNGKGELEITEILVRVSQPGAPITTHASSYLFDDFFTRVLGYPAEQAAAIKDLVQEFVAGVYEAIEDAYGPYGEIGVDLALDKAGRLWFIECNSRSAKISLFNAAGEEARVRSYLNPFEYAKFLYHQQAKTFSPPKQIERTDLLNPEVTTKTHPTRQN
jgi:hypothetical protein